jgi:hypothetical protein
MKKFGYIFVGIFFLFLWHQKSFTAQDSYTISAQKNFSIELDTRNKGEKKSFSFADYDITAPSVCHQANVYCHEKTTIHTYIEKEWEIIPIPQIWDKTLTPQQFAQFYPDLPDTTPINDWSPSQQKWITQRILYERGLLDVFPTGKIGFKTEEAIIKLQYYKDIEEVDERLGIVIIGPKTIKELNALKSIMEEPEFISRSGLPPISSEDLTPFHKKRLEQINSEIVKRPLPPESEILVPQMGIVKPKNSGNMLKFSGEAYIHINE